MIEKYFILKIKLTLLEKKWVLSNVNSERVKSDEKLF